MGYKAFFLQKERVYMVAKDQVRLVFWIFVFFVIAILFYSIATNLLPRLIRYQMLPTSGTYVVDTALSIEERFAINVCSLWLSIKEFQSQGYSERIDVKSTLGDVTESGTRDKLGDDCKGASFSLSRNLVVGITYEVEFKINRGETNIILDAKEK